MFGIRNVFLRHLLLPLPTYRHSTLHVTLLEQRVDKYAHDELMVEGHSFYVFIHINPFFVKTAIAEPMHDIVVKPLHVNALVDSCWRNAIGKSFEYQMVAEERKIISA